MSNEAKFVEYQTIRKIFDKAGAPQPYNIRRMYGGFYHLAIRVEDAREFVNKLDVPYLQQIIKISEGAAAPGIFSGPPLKNQTPEQICNAVVESMGFALGRSYHPATEKLYDKICAEAGHADLINRIKVKARAIRTKAMDLAKHLKRGGAAPRNNNKKNNNKNNNNNKKEEVQPVDTVNNTSEGSTQATDNNNDNNNNDNDNIDNNNDVQMLNYE